MPLFAIGKSATWIIIQPYNRIEIEKVEEKYEKEEKCKFHTDNYSDPLHCSSHSLSIF